MTALRPALVSVALAMLVVVPAQAGSVLDRILAEKSIRLGVRTDAPPFASLVDGRPAGFTVELCGLIAGAIVQTSGIDELVGTFVTVDTGERFDALKDGRIDVLCGATTATLTRREAVSFSIPTFSTGIGAVVRADAPELLREVLVAGGPAALSKAAIGVALGGQTLGVRADTTAEDWVTDGPLSAIEGIETRAVDDHAAGIAGVEDGSLAAYFADKAILLGVLSGRADATSFEISRNTFTTEPYALALPRGDEDLRLTIDRALSFLYRQGAIYQIYERYFGKPTAEVALFYTIVALPE